MAVSVVRVSVDGAPLRVASSVAGAGWAVSAGASMGGCVSAIVVDNSAGEVDWEFLSAEEEPFRVTATHWGKSAGYGVLSRRKLPFVMLTSRRLAEKLPWRFTVNIEK